MQEGEVGDGRLLAVIIYQIQFDISHFTKNFYLYNVLRTKYYIDKCNRLITHGYEKSNEAALSNIDITQTITMGENVYHFLQLLKVITVITMQCFPPRHLILMIYL